MNFAPNCPDLKLTEILNHIETRMFIKDSNGIYIACNEPFAKDAGLSKPDELFGKSDFDLPWKENAENYRKDDFNVIKTGISIINKIESQITPDANKKYLITSKYPIKDQNKNIIAVLGLYNDITQIKQMELKQLETQKRTLQTQRLESMGLLAGGVAHDFNNYLLSIIGNLDMIMSDNHPNQKLIEQLNEIKNQTQELTKLTKQLLAFSGKGKFTLNSINLNDVISEISQLIRASVPKKIQLNYQLEKNLLLIEGDHGQIQQMLINLITNAIEAIGDANGTITIATGIRTIDSDYINKNKIGNMIDPGIYVYIEITDTGEGIPPEIQERMFEPFFSTKEVGRGLGLSAVMGIVKGHNGTINVYSEPKKGSTIKCLFPAQNAQHKREGKETLVSETPTNKKQTIMVVDDELMVRNTLKRILEKSGYDVILADDGIDAISKFKNYKDEISLVIMDLTMPKMDGATAFSELKLIKSNVKVLLSSGYNEQELSQRFVSKGLAGFLQKPYGMKDLLEKIKKII